MFGWTMALLCALWLNSNEVLANSPPAKSDFTIVADESEVKIRVWYGSGASYSRSFRLTATSSDLSQRDEVTFNFLSDDLVSQDDRVLDRQYITLEPKNDYKLNLNTPKNFQVTVTGIQEPGTYRGKMEFYPQGVGREKSLKLDLIVEALPAQPLIPFPSTAQVTLHLSRGWLSKILLPTGETIGEKVLTFENPYRINVSLTEKKVILNGENNGYQLNSPLVAVGAILNQGQQGASIIKIPLELKRNEIPPDRYTGIIFLKEEGAKEALKLPMTLTVRYGPLLSIILLIVGFLLGAFVSLMKSVGLALAELENKWNKLRGRIDQIDPQDRDIFLPYLYAVRRNIDDKEQQEAAQGLKKIEDYLFMLEAMYSLKNLVDPQKWSAAMINFRSCISRDDDAGAKKVLDDLRKEGLKVAIIIEKILNKLRRIPQPDWWSRLRAWWQNWKWTFCKWGFYIILLFIFIYVGFTTVYLKILTFGASGVSDYGSLLLWGFGSEFASGNLTSVLDKLKSS